MGEWSLYAPPECIELRRDDLIVAVFNDPRDLGTAHRVMHALNCLDELEQLVSALRPLARMVGEAEHTMRRLRDATDDVLRAIPDPT